ncbi:hypothetical protein [Pseudomonas umsongensis]|uniref:Uncharacterized protein n=1 Tax=Pseudomonas umsongensis TaxID=198618 RepID=A0AAE6ZTA9_9PSED|nr:hypothetical protein [Pseudomonas umsongensis]QJC78935.1 hypothetical protein HGP31_11640 [Pseudomonas umsongensis]
MALPTPTDLQRMALPKKFTALLSVLGLHRPAHVDSKEWHQLCQLYKVMWEAKQGDGFEALAKRLIAHISYYQKTIEAEGEAFVSIAISRKKRRKANRCGLFIGNASFSDSSQEAARKRNSTPKIGLGVKSILAPPQRTRREELKIDSHTQLPEKSPSSHILYVAGWTLSSEQE